MVQVLLALVEADICSSFPSLNRLIDMSDRLKHIQRDQVREIAKRCNLKEETVYDLFTTGWVYQESLDTLPRWIHPAANLEITKPTL